MDICADRERRHLDLLAAVEEAEASLAGGEGSIMTRQDLKDLADDVHRRGLPRLADERSVFP